jgi:hypothetical protein
LILFEKKPKPKPPVEKTGLGLEPVAPGAFAGISLVDRF